MIRSMIQMNDVLGRPLYVGSCVAYATTVHPGWSSHAILKTGTVRKICMGRKGVYASVKPADRDSPCLPIRESRKIVKLV